MTQYVGCEQARELLEGLIDGELSMADQLTVESHLRWCRTCALRVDDMQVIGESLRNGLATRCEAADQEVSAIGEAVLMRVRAEQSQSWTVRMRETFSDMRLLWPAVGATAAVAICVSVASSVLHATSIHRDQSLASLITSLSNPTPLRPTEDDFFGIAIPRPFEADAERAGRTLDALPEEDVIYTVRTVLDRQGRISYSEVLLSNSATRERTSVHAVHDRAVLDAIAQTRFASAHTALGQPVAFDMVWVIAKTTAVQRPLAEVVAPIAAPVVTAEPEPTALEEPVITDIPLSSTHPRWRFRVSTTA